MLGTIGDVIDALGGNAKMAALCGVGNSAVSNWRSRDRIPAEKFIIVKEALTALGMEVDPALFGIEPAEARP